MTSFRKQIFDKVKPDNQDNDGTIRLYRGMTQKFSRDYDRSKLDAPNGYTSWTDNIDLAKQYAGSDGFVHYIDLPKSQAGKEAIDNNPKSETYGDRHLFFYRKKAGLNNISGREFLVYHDHDLYHPDMVNVLDGKDHFNGSSTDLEKSQYAKTEPVEERKKESKSKKIIASTKKKLRDAIKKDGKMLIEAQKGTTHAGTNEIKAKKRTKKTGKAKVGEQLNKSNNSLKLEEINDIVNNKTHIAAESLKKCDSLSKDHVSHIVKHYPVGAAEHLKDHKSLTREHVQSIIDSSPYSAAKYLANNKYYQDIISPKSDKETVEKSYIVKFLERLEKASKKQLLQMLGADPKANEVADWVATNKLRDDIALWVTRSYKKDPNIWNEDNRQKILHYVTQNHIPEINNFRFTKDHTFEGGLEQLGKLEQDHFKRQLSEGRWSDERLVDPNGDANDIPLGDGFVWNHDDNPVNESVGANMKHCGNSGDPDSDDTQWNLIERKMINGKPMERVHATFIANGNTLGEMKGVNNASPSPKFNKYYAELFKHVPIKALVGGGYRPESNLVIDSLEPELQAEVKKYNPELVDLNSDSYSRADYRRAMAHIPKVQKLQSAANERTTAMDLDDMLKTGNSDFDSTIYDTRNIPLIMNNPRATKLTREHLSNAIQYLDNNRNNLEGGEHRWGNFIMRLKKHPLLDEDHVTELCQTSPRLAAAEFVNNPKFNRDHYRYLLTKSGSIDSMIKSRFVDSPEEVSHILKLTPEKALNSEIFNNPHFNDTHRELIETLQRNDKYFDIPLKYINSITDVEHLNILAFTALGRRGYLSDSLKYSHHPLFNRGDLIDTCMEHPSRGSANTLIDLYRQDAQQSNTTSLNKLLVPDNVMNMILDYADPEDITTALPHLNTGKLPIDALNKIIQLVPSMGVNESNIPRGLQNVLGFFTHSQTESLNDPHIANSLSSMAAENMGYGTDHFPFGNASPLEFRKMLFHKSFADTGLASIGSKSRSLVAENMGLYREATDWLMTHHPYTAAHIYDEDIDKYIPHIERILKEQPRALTHDGILSTANSMAIVDKVVNSNPEFWSNHLAQNAPSLMSHVDNLSHLSKDSLDALFSESSKMRGDKLGDIMYASLYDNNTNFNEQHAKYAFGKGADTESFLYGLHHGVKNGGLGANHPIITDDIAKRLVAQGSSNGLARNIDKHSGDKDLNLESFKANLDAFRANPKIVQAFQEQANTPNPYDDDLAKSTENIEAQYKEVMLANYPKEFVESVLAQDDDIAEHFRIKPKFDKTANVIAKYIVSSANLNFLGLYLLKNAFGLNDLEGTKLWIQKIREALDSGKEVYASINDQSSKLFSKIIQGGKFEVEHIGQHAYPWGTWKTVKLHKKNQLHKSFDAIDFTPKFQLRKALAGLKKIQNRHKQEHDSIVSFDDTAAMHAPNDQLQQMHESPTKFPDMSKHYDGISAKTIHKSDAGTFMVKPFHKNFERGTENFCKYPISGWASLTNKALYHAGGIGHLCEDVSPASIQGTPTVVSKFHQLINPTHFTSHMESPESRMNHMQIATMDYLTNNQDRHLFNLGYTFTGDKFHPVAIDHDRSFQYGLRKGGDMFDIEDNKAFMRATDHLTKPYHDVAAPVRKWWNEKKDKIREEFHKHSEGIKDEHFKGFMKTSFDKRFSEMDRFLLNPQHHVNAYMPSYRKVRSKPLMSELTAIEKVSDPMQRLEMLKDLQARRPKDIDKRNDYRDIFNRKLALAHVESGHMGEMSGNVLHEVNRLASLNHPKVDNYLRALYNHDVGSKLPPFFKERWSKYKDSK